MFTAYLLSAVKKSKEKSLDSAEREIERDRSGWSDPPFCRQSEGLPDMPAEPPLNKGEGLESGLRCVSRVSLTYSI